MSQVPDSPSHPWWGPFDLEAGAVGRWEVGPSTVWVHRGTLEWVVVHASGADSLAAGSNATVPLPAEEGENLVQTALHEDAEGWDVTRYGVQTTVPGLHMQPALADRPVVIRPEHPLFVPEGETVTMFVSTPLWIQVRIRPDDRLLHEVPAYRPSDTWFGPNTREGELCYAVQTTGRLRLETLPLRRHRAVTPLTVRNQADDTLHVERVEIPTPHLALYEGPNRFLWTQGVRFARERGRDGARVDVQSGPPKQAPNATQLQAPRESDRSNLFVSTFRTVGSWITG